VEFDKAAWEQSGETWELPLHIEGPDVGCPDGTRVTLTGLTKAFDEQEVERRLIESVPIQAPGFHVYLNGRQLVRRPHAGQRMPFMEGTPFGVVHGELILLPASAASATEAGIACKVKQVLVRREFFGMEAWGPVANRLVGEAHADFVPLASDRSDFIRDTPNTGRFGKRWSRWSVAPTG
jgi:hypothetical protein